MEQLQLAYKVKCKDALYKKSIWLERIRDKNHHGRWREACFKAFDSNLNTGMPAPRRMPVCKAHALKK